jgi:hypothetical protein
LKTGRRVFGPITPGKQHFPFIEKAETLSRKGARFSAIALRYQEEAQKIQDNANLSEVGKKGLLAELRAKAREEARRALFYSPLSEILLSRPDGHRQDPGEQEATMARKRQIILSWLISRAYPRFTKLSACAVVVTP